MVRRVVDRRSWRSKVADYEEEMDDDSIYDVDNIGSRKTDFSELVDLIQTISQDLVGVDDHLAELFTNSFRSNLLIEGKWPSSELSKFFEQVSMSIINIGKFF
jgi:hypothetical protein